MNLLNNWLFQTVVGNAICFILGKIVLYFYQILKTNNNNTFQKPLSKYSKKTLRKQFYISLGIDIILIVLLFFFIGNNYFTVIATTIIFWSTLFIIFAFECSLECFEDFPCNRCQ